MEPSVKDQRSPADNSAKLVTSKLKNPLRSSTKKLKADKSPRTAHQPSSASKRARAASSVCQSLSVLNLSEKEDSAKPHRRLYTPSKSARKSLGSNITPISEPRVRKSVTTPLSRSSAGRKFNVLLSASYWLSQIKVSESVPNHSVSLGFFRLALEAGCEPIQRLRDELKAYAIRHNITDLGETVKALFESYGIVESLEQLQVSETHREGGTQSSSNEAINCSSRSLMGRKQPVVTQSLSSIDHVPVKSALKNSPSSKVRASITRKSVTPRPAAAEGEAQKRTEKLRKVKPENGHNMIKKLEKKKPSDEASAKLTAAEDTVEENKENMSVQDGIPAEEISVP